MKEWQQLNFFEKVKNLFTGRINRKYYFLSTVIFTFVYVVLFIVLITIHEFFDNAKWFYIFLIIPIIGGIVYLLSLHVRRLHDIGINGLWLITILVISKIAENYLESDSLIISMMALAVEFGLLLFIFFYPSQPKRNEYGNQNQHASLVDALLQRPKKD